MKDISNFEIKEIIGGDSPFRDFGRWLANSIEDFFEGGGGTSHHTDWSHLRGPKY